MQLLRPQGFAVLGHCFRQTAAIQEMVSRFDIGHAVQRGATNTQSRPGGGLWGFRRGAARSALGLRLADSLHALPWVLCGAVARDLPRTRPALDAAKVVREVVRWGCVARSAGDGWRVPRRLYALFPQWGRLFSLIGLRLRALCGRLPQVAKALAQADGALVPHQHMSQAPVVSSARSLAFLRGFCIGLGGSPSPRVFVGWRLNNIVAWC